MKFEGKVIYVSSKEQRRTGENKNGAWAVDFFVVEETSARYPTRISFEVFSTKEKPLWKDWGLQVGYEVSVDFDIDCREYQGKWYNSVRAYKVEPVGMGEDVRPVQQPAQQPSERTQQYAAQLAGETTDTGDSLPF